MEPAFTVIPYCIGTLKSLLATKSGASPNTVNSKLHTKYFEDYFNKLSARTIVVENSYIDRDFLQDFAAYYVYCFQPYRRTCTRLHFFSKDFDESAFKSVIEGTAGSLTIEQIDECYLGFVVIKPLPKTVIGRTCLKTYPAEGRRYYPTVRCHKAHLFGIPLKIDTVAFQEQDQSVAVCATSALWSLFQCTARLFDHYLPSPVEITKAATEPAIMDTRILPNSGLTTIQMAEAIRKLQLEPYLVGAEDRQTLQSTIYAYLKARIPGILKIELLELENGVVRESKGWHAVAVTGYSFGNTAPAQLSDIGIRLRSGRIDKIYAHDDQVGPFAKMEFNDFDGRTILTTSWGVNDENSGAVIAKPSSVLFPLYRKIRIPLAAVQDVLVEFDRLLEEFRRKGLVQYTQRLEWDLYLTYLNDFKNEIINGVLPATVQQRSRFLNASLPRFLWRATAFDEEKPIIDLLFDATDIEQGNFFLDALEYDETLAEVLRVLSNSPALSELLKDSAAWQIFQRLKD